MKRIIGIMLCAFNVLSLTACSPFDLEAAKVTINGITYRRGFYDSLLYPDNITFQEGSNTVNGKVYHHVDFERFDCVHREGGGSTAGRLYCAEDQWKEAQAYYADSNNFLYYCSIGVKNETKGTAPVVFEISDIDPEKYDSLMTFADKNRYKAFGAANRKTHRMPIPNSEESPVLSFYKESKDGLLSSIKGCTFYVVDDKLVLLYRYDYGHGKYKEMLVVDPPKKLNQYFVELVKKYL